MNITNLAQIRWNCRRGMLELDVMLQQFFDKHYLNLSTLEQKYFQQLLTCQDQELFHWLLGADRPENQAMRAMVEKIRDNRLSRTL